MKHTSLLLSLLLIALLCFPACSGDDGVQDDQNPSFDDDAGLESDVEEEGDDEEDDEGDDEEEEEDPPGPPRIDIFPSTLNFSGIAPGDVARSTVTVRNLGESPLFLVDAQLNQFGVSGSEVFQPADSWPEFPVYLDPSTFRDLDVIFAPDSPGSFRGELVLFSDDPDDEYISLRIETVSYDPELEAPSRISFGSVAAGDSETIRIEVYNRGSTPMQLHPPEITGDDGQDEAFSVEVIGLPSLPGFLDRNAFVYMDVAFAPDQEGPQAAELSFQTSDPLHPTFTIDLSGNRPTPCLQTSGDVDFGTINPGASAERTFTILNCSLNRNLTVEDFEISDDGGGVFSFVSPPEDPLLIPPVQTRTISLRAAPSAEQEVVGTLRFQSNDPDAEQVEQSLRIHPPFSGD